MQGRAPILSTEGGYKIERSEQSEEPFIKTQDAQSCKPLTAGKIGECRLIRQAIGVTDK